MRLDHAPTLEQVRVPLWAWLVFALAVATMYLLTMENGVALAERAPMLHEFVHDARHFAAVPCH